MPTKPYQRGMLALVAVTLCLACQRAEDRRIRRAVTVKELCGDWTLTPTGTEGVRYGAQFRGHHANSPHAHDPVYRLTLNQTGSCSYSAPSDPCGHGVRVFSAEEPCTWALRRESEYQQVFVTVGPADHRFSQPYYVTEENATLLLFFPVCDPDDWKYIELRKTSGGA